MLEKGDLLHTPVLSESQGELGALVSNQISKALKILKVLKVLNMLMAGSLSILPISMRSAHNFSSARPARASADVMQENPPDAPPEYHLRQDPALHSQVQGAR